MTHNNIPLELKRITTVYVDKEDRIGLIGVAESGQHHRLWLTQRLLTQLIERLLLWLPQNPEEIQQIAQQMGMVVILLHKNMNNFRMTFSIFCKFRSPSEKEK